MRFEPDDINLEGLDKLVKALKVKNPPHIELGIIGTKAERKGDGPSDAQIGAAHEYGAPAINLPPRSFLRMPMIDHFPNKLESSGAIGEAEFKEVVKTGSIIPWMHKIKILALETVIEGFMTQGWGTWDKWKDPNYENNANMILQDTGQLLDAQDAKIVQ